MRREKPKLSFINPLAIFGNFSKMDAKLSHFPNFVQSKPIPKINISSGQSESTKMGEIHVTIHASGKREKEIDYGAYS